MSRYEKKLKNKLDDKIKFDGLEALVPEEHEKHLILNSNHLRTLEDARLEVVTCVEAKFVLRNRDSKPGDTGSCGHSDPMDVAAVNSLLSGKGKGSSSPRDGCFKCGGAHFQRHCNARKSTGKQSSNSKETQNANPATKGVHKGETSTTGLSALENSKSETSSETQESAQTCPTDNSWIQDG